MKEDGKYTYTYNNVRAKSTPKGRRLFELCWKKRIRLDGLVWWYVVWINVFQVVTCSVGFFGKTVISN